MKLLLPILASTALLQGCAAYVIGSTITTIATGKSIPDHAASTVTQHDCNTLNTLARKQDYLCEQRREPGTTYNRNGL